MTVPYQKIVKAGLAVVAAFFGRKFVRGLLDQLEHSVGNLDVVPPQRYAESPAEE